MKYVAPTAPLAIGGVLDDWIRLFRASFRGCWALALIATLADALFQLAVTPKFPVPRPGAPSLRYYLQYWATLRAPSVLLYDILLWLVLLLTYGALLAQQVAILRGEPLVAFATAWANSLRRLPQMLLGVLLLVLIFAAVWFPVGIGAALLIPLRQSTGAVLFAALMVIAAIVAMIYLWARLQLWMAVIFVEGSGGASALGRSWDLVKGHWWRVTGIGFVAGVIVWVLAMAIEGLMGAAIGFMGIRGVAPDLLFRRMQLIGAIGGLSRMLTMPLLTAVWLAIYHDLTLRREGGDLAARAEALSGT